MMIIRRLPRTWPLRSLCGAASELAAEGAAGIATNTPPNQQITPGNFGALTWQRWHCIDHYPASALGRYSPYPSYLAGLSQGSRAYGSDSCSHSQSAEDSDGGEDGNGADGGNSPLSHGGVGASRPGGDSGSGGGAKTKGESGSGGDAKKKGESVQKNKRKKLDWSQPKSLSLTPEAAAPVAAYVNRLGPLLQAELDEEQRLIDERLRQWPLQRLVSEGVVLLGMVAWAQKGALFGKVVLSMVAQQGGKLPFHQFSSGDAITLCQGDPLTEKTYEALVFAQGRFELQIAVRANVAAQLQGKVWRIDHDVNLTTFKRATAALRSLYRTAAAASTMSGSGASADTGSSLISVSSAGDGGSDGHPRECGDDQSVSGAGGTAADAQEEQQAAQGGRKKKNKWVDENPGPHPGVLAVLTATSSRDAATAARAASGLMPALALDWAQRVRPAALAAGPGQPPTGSLTKLEVAEGLNDSQSTALALTLQHRVTLLQGPPGTGKTSAIACMLYLLCRNFGFSGPILACAQSNVAVDNLLENLVDLGVRAVRVGQPVRVREGLRNATLDAGLLKHPLQRQLGQLLGEVFGLKQRLSSLEGQELDVGRKNVSKKQQEISAMRQQVSRDVLQGAEVVCATCVGSGGDQLHGINFGLVVLDEGSQCSEPEALIPLSHGAAHVVLVGDHCQLPPVVRSAVAQQGGLAQSLFARLMAFGQEQQGSSITDRPGALGTQGLAGQDETSAEGAVSLRAPPPASTEDTQSTEGAQALPSTEGVTELAAGAVPTAMLTVQYRMHPSLSAFPSAEFYGGRLVDGVTAQKRQLPGGWGTTRRSGRRRRGLNDFVFPSPQHPVAFIDVVDGVEAAAHDGSKSNMAEARIVVRLVRQLLRPAGMAPGSIGVITPYLAQVRLLCSLLQGTVPTFRLDSDARAPGSGELEVKTVDGYQGREKEVIIVSCVRANTKGLVGFLDDWRRLNVAITRPKCALLLVGHAKTLQANKHWQRYLSWLRDNGCIKSVTTAAKSEKTGKLAEKLA